ncbi:uncharacterized protein BKA78DRAFT_15174 [Phyllosticta capitalensis]|uniref:uncharacterized protein n=1 Tax=Phyllosticta capitalensis TaxID=121624 RepID=UPI00312E6B85
MNHFSLFSFCPCFLSALVSFLRSGKQQKHRKMQPSRPRQATRHNTLRLVSTPARFTTFLRLAALPLSKALYTDVSFFLQTASSTPACSRQRSKRNRTRTLRCSKARTRGRRPGEILDAD